jgi:hypothetical protein
VVQQNDIFQRVKKFLSEEQKRHLRDIHRSVELQIVFDSIIASHSKVISSIPGPRAFEQLQECR